MKARRRWAWPLVPIYAAALGVKDGLRRVGVLRTRRLGWPVVSVGSLSAGGAGKTPVVIALAELLQDRAWKVDVLSRGYGRSGTGVERVDSKAADAAARFGDEPVLLSRRLQVPVWVGSNRFAAGTEAEASSGATGVARGIHLLDDGFQHRGLVRAVDVVLVTEADLEDALLPAGNRRERFTALRRADVIVLREEERERVEARVSKLMHIGAVVWIVRRALIFPDQAVGLGAGARLVGFCAIARPDGFWAMLALSGCEVAETVAFGDHHAYVAADLERLVKVAGDSGATGFITTEKDSMKLSPAMLERLRGLGPVCVAELEARFVDEADVLRDLEARIS